MPYDQPELSYAGLGQYDVTNRPVFRGKDINIPVARGFRTDLATSPRIFWAFVPPFGAYEAAAVLHDWLLSLLKRYVNALKEYRVLLAEGVDAEEPEAPPVNSVDTDGWFRRIMRESGVGFVRRWTMWTAVRWGAVFSDYRREGWLCWPEAPLVFAISTAWLVVTVAGAVGIHLAVDLVWSWIS